MFCIWQVGFFLWHRNDYLNDIDPKPFEIICYHCQQAIEKMLKGVLLSKGVGIKKTYDLGLLAEMLMGYMEVDERYLEMCDDLTPYGVKLDTRRNCLLKNIM